MGSRGICVPTENIIDGFGQGVRRWMDVGCCLAHHPWPGFSAHLKGDFQEQTLQGCSQLHGCSSTLLMLGIEIQILFLKDCNFHISVIVAAEIS